MKNVLVGGGTGGVGEGIVRALLAAGHLVVVPSRSAAKLERLRGDLAPGGTAGERLVTVEADVGALAGALAVRERIEREVGRIDALVPSLGGWWEGALLDVTPAVWDDVMNEMLRTHFIFAHVFLPVVREQRDGGRYIAIGGGAAYHPVRGSSLVSIAAAAQAMFTRALHQELTESNVEVVELIVDGPVRTRDSAALAAPDWITAGEVGAVVAELVAHGRTSDPAVRAAGPLLRMRPHPRSGVAR